MRPGLGPESWDLDLEAGIWASRLGVGPRGLKTQDSLGLKTGIWASRLHGGKKKEEEEEEGKEKFPRMRKLRSSKPKKPTSGPLPKKQATIHSLIKKTILTSTTKNAMKKKDPKSVHLQDALSPFQTF